MIRVGAHSARVAGLVDDAGGVAGASADALLAGLHQGSDHCGAAGADHQGDQGALCDDVQGVQSGLSDAGQHVVGAASGDNSLVDGLQSDGSGDLCCGMGVEHNGVACGQVADAVAGDGSGGDW